MGDWPYETNPLSSTHHYEFSYQDDFFKHPSTTPEDTPTTHFSLIERSYPTDQPPDSADGWTRFVRYLAHLNATAAPGEKYKLLFLQRHGEGWHNVMEARVGTKLWDCYYSRLDGDGKITWADADLTPLGQSQAKQASALWKDGLANSVPPPQKYIVSPLQRCCATAHLTFSSLELPDKAAPFVPEIRELLRECIGVHTCDRRSSKTTIGQKWPDYNFEKSFVEDDELWDKDWRESNGQQVHRLSVFLDGVYDLDEEHMSLTSHNGSIMCMQQAVGLQGVYLNTGEVMPLLVKGTLVQGPRKVGKIDPPTKEPVCEPPDDNIGNHEED